MPPVACVLGLRRLASGQPLKVLATHSSASGHLRGTTTQAATNVSEAEAFASLGAGLGPASIFDRIPQPKAKPVDNDGLALFGKLASPSDVPLQFVHVVRAGIRDVRTWEVLSASAVRSLRYMRVSEVAAILDSCAQVSWRDDNLLCGLSEAFRCGAELRRGTVRDYALCCQSLRRLGYCPWVGALRPIVAELRWRLHRHRWRPVDIVFVLRFLMAFDLHKFPRLPQAAALGWELQEQAEKRLGEMKHLELTHLARALALATPAAGQHAELLGRCAENFSRRAHELPLGPLLHITASLVRARAPAPTEFCQVLAKRAQADLAKLRPYEVAFIASASARLELRDAGLLIQLDRAVGSSIDRFTPGQIATIAKAFDLLGHPHRALLDYMEQSLFARPAASRPVSANDRCRMLASLVGAAARSSRSLSPDVLRQCFDELVQALDVLATGPRSRSTPPRIVVNDVIEQRKGAVRRIESAAQRPPQPMRTAGRRRRGPQRPAPAAPEASPSAGRQQAAARAASSAPTWRPESLGAIQLDALRDIALTVGMDIGAAASMPLMRGNEAGGSLDFGGNTRRRGGRRMISSFVPAGAAVIRPRQAGRLNKAQIHFEQVLGGVYPAAVRMRRRLARLERELKIGASEAPPGVRRARPPTLGDEPMRETRQRNPLRVRTRGATPHARAAILWRRLRRYRLGSFQVSESTGRFSKAPSELSMPKDAVGHTYAGLSLEHTVVLAAALVMREDASPPPGRDALLQRLGTHCWWLLQGDGRGGVLPSVGRIAAALGSASVASPRLVDALEAAVAGAADVGCDRGGVAGAASSSALYQHHPRVFARVLEAYSRLLLADAPSGSMQVSPRHQRTIQVLLDRLALEGPLARGSQSMWTLPLDEIAGTVAALAELLQDPGLLELRFRRALRRGLREQLTGRPGLALARPPSAANIARLVAAWLWLARRRGCGAAAAATATAAASPAPSRPPWPAWPHAVTEACRRWAVSPGRAEAVLTSWCSER